MPGKRFDQIDADFEAMTNIIPSRSERDDVVLSTRRMNSGHAALTDRMQRPV
jgi:hypothetical protein